MMKTSEQGISLIKKFEGFSAEAYFCPAGKLTIGYGHVIKPLDILATVIDEETATDLLKSDVALAEESVNWLVKVPLLQYQFDALVSFTFNVGRIAFKNSTLLLLINKRDYILASKQLERWVYANGVKLDGLMHRRQAEMQLFLGNS